MMVRIMRSLATCAAVAAVTLFAGTVGARTTTVTCESLNNREQVCRVPSGPVTLHRQLSNRSCIKGQSWGFNSHNNTIWVRNGCRAEFRAGHGGAHRPPQGMTVTCESINNREQVCGVPHGPVTLIRQLSNRSCIKGQSWGFNSRNNTIWVRNGCRAEFRAGHGSAHRPPQPITVTCESINNREQVCRVPRGPVRLVRQLSNSHCTQGQSWGFNSHNNTIWVRNGCRAEFRVA